MIKTFKSESRLDWGRETQGGTPTNEEIQFGAILRIADATEAMAKNYTDLQNQLARYKQYWSDERKATERLKRSNASLRGHIARIKRKN
jgi:IS1 family transposase